MPATFTEEDFADVAPSTQEKPKFTEDDFADVTPKFTESDFKDTAKSDLYNASIQATPKESTFDHVIRSARESMSPILGPTETQRLSEGILTSDGDIAYKPLGSKIDSE